MAKRKVEEIDFNCVVCIDTLLEPASLPCGHTICMECMERLDYDKCPVCRQSFRSNNVKKNVLLSTVIESLYGDNYKKRVKARQDLKQYYGSERFDVLCDAITDIVSEGKEIVKESSNEDDDDAPREFPKFFVTLDDIIDIVTVHDINKQFKYHPAEIKACVNEQLKDKQIYKVKNFYIINGEDWIVDNIVENAKQLDNEDILFMMANVIKSSISDEIGVVLKRRRLEATSRDIDMEKVNSELVDLIKSKKIEL